MNFIVHVKKSDLLIEFRENQTERFLVPQDILFGERIPSACSGRHDMELGFFVPWGDSPGEDASPRPAILLLRKAPIALSDMIWNWLSDGARRRGAKQAFQQKV